MHQPQDKLSDEQKRVLIDKGTEAPFTGKFNAHKEDGTYVCGQCGANLFSSETKFDSGSGWPSFYDVVDKANVELISDSSHGMVRTEVVCRSCNGHLGHVFDDGPGDKTGQRYCINSASLCFRPEGSKDVVRGD